MPKSSPSWAPYEPHPGRDQGEIGDGGRKEQLPQRLGPSDRVRLADAQVHQSGDAMFGDLTKAPIRREGRAVLKGASLLEERLLGMKTNATSLAGFGADALRAQGAGVAQRGVEAKSLH